MAYTKIWSIKTRLDSSLNYIVNPEKTKYHLDMEAAEDVEKYIRNDDKTEQGLYVKSFNCRKDAYKRMLKTQKKFGKHNRKNGVIAYHIVQSFKDFETTPEIAHQAGLEFAQRLFADNYEVVVATHLDQDHYHNHIIINSVSFKSGKKYRNNFKDYFGDIRGISDDICRKHCLSVIENPKHRGMKYAEAMAEKKGDSIRCQVRRDIDEIIKSSYTMKDFWRNLEKRGFVMKRFGAKYKFTSFVPPYGDRAIRLDKLGKHYTEEAIQERIIAARNGIQMASPSDMYKGGFDFDSQYKHYESKKLKGFVALYYHYLYLFGKIKKKQVPQRVSFYLRDEIVKLERYQKQFKFLYNNNIETVADLTAHHRKAEARIDELITQRKALYEERTEENTDEVKSKAKEINTELTTLRSELRMCKAIYSDVEKITQKKQQADSLQQQAEMEVMQNEHKRRSR